jgi:hypothetical protein
MCLRGGGQIVIGRDQKDSADFLVMLAGQITGGTGSDRFTDQKNGTRRWML